MSKSQTCGVFWMHSAMHPLYSLRSAVICGFWTEHWNRKVVVVLLLCAAPSKNANACDFQRCSLWLCCLKNVYMWRGFYSPFSYLALSSLLGIQQTNKFIFWPCFFYCVILQGPLKGRRVEDIQYEDISKLAWGANGGSEKILVPKNIFLASCRQTQDSTMSGF